MFARRLSHQIFYLAVIAIICFLSGSSLYAQRVEDTGSSGGTGKIGGGSSASGKIGGRTGGRTNAAPRVVTITKTVERRPITGNLTVGVVNGETATIKLEVLNRRNNAYQPVAQGEQKLNEEEAAVTFEGLPPGKYRITATRQSYRDATPEETLVTVGKTATVNLNLEPITHNVTFRLNADEGMLEYRQGNEDYSVRPFTKGTVTLQALTPGDYDLRIKPKGSFKEKQQKYTVPANAPAAGLNVQLNLDPRPAAEAFDGSSPSSWAKMPATWRYTSGKLILNGSGATLPAQEPYRYYDDFGLTANVKLNNGKGIGFILRASDENNYYLVKLGGSNADDPYSLRAYRVRGGQREQFGNPLYVKNISDIIKSNKFFQLKIFVKNSTIFVGTVDPEDSNNTLFLGFFTDEQRTYPIGAAGLFSEAGENSEVENFNLCVVGRSGCALPSGVSLDKWR